LLLLILGTLETKETKYKTQANTNDGDDDACGYFRRGGVGWLIVCRNYLLVDVVGVGDDVCEGVHLLVET
jgi:hypothetical protein